MYSSFLSLHDQYTKMKAEMPSDAKVVKALVTSLEALEKEMEAAKLYSANETLDELQTKSMFMMAVPYCMADLLLAAPGIDDRLPRVEAALVHLTMFLRLCKNYDLIDKRDIKLLKDAKIPRDEKIERYKREQEIDKKLQYLQDERRKRISSKQKSIQNDDENIDDGEYDREIVLLLMKSLIPKAFSHINFSQQELPFLKRRAAEQQDPRMAQKAKEEQKLKQANAKKPFMYKVTPDNVTQPMPTRVAQHLSLMPQQSTGYVTSGKLNPTVQTSGMTNATNVDRVIAQTTHAHANLFHNSNPYTYTPEQWAEREIAEGRLAQAQPAPVFAPLAKEARGYVLSSNEREGRDAFLEAKARADAGQDDEEGNDGCCPDPSHDHEQNYDAEEAKRIKDSEWADWQDDHQKGEGAKYNTHSLYNQDKKP